MSEKLSRLVMFTVVAGATLLAAGCASTGTQTGYVRESGGLRTEAVRLNPGKPISLGALRYTDAELVAVNRLALAGAGLVLPDAWSFLPASPGTEIGRAPTGASAFYFADPDGMITGQVQRFDAPFRSDARSLAQYYVDSVRPTQPVIRSQPITIGGLEGFVVFLDASASAPMMMTLIIEADVDGQISVEVADTTGGIEADPLPVLQLIASLTTEHPSTQTRTLPSGLTFSDPEHQWTWAADLGDAMVLYPSATEAPFSVVLGPREAFARSPLDALLEGEPVAGPVEVDLLIANQVATVEAQDYEVAGRRRTRVDFSVLDDDWRAVIVHRRSARGDLAEELTTEPIPSLFARNLVFARSDSQ
ncbi:MAG: hypothetical protein PF508_04000 [Spirochaeta sp.]|nr:hypothetical protein [Spirochaeta sp.]